MSQASTAMIEESKLPRNMRRVVTPEGVPLHMTLATVAARAVAFSVDMCVILAMLIGVMIIAALAASIGEERDTIEEVVEPYLLQQGFIQRTPRGRLATQASFTHLGIPTQGSMI